jgi:hypothetical protein
MKEYSEKLLKGERIFIKKYFDDTELPDWEQCLSLLYNGLQEQFDRKVDGLEDLPELAPYEKIVGNVMITYNTYFNLKSENHFSNLKNLKVLLQKIQNLFDQNVNYNGIVIDLGGRKVPRHRDDWTAISIQVCGGTTWTISDDHLSGNPSFNENYIMERGDLLVVPAGMLHLVKSPGPRVNFLFNILGSETPDLLNK